MVTEGGFDLKKVTDQLLESIRTRQKASRDKMRNRQSEEPTFQEKSPRRRQVAEESETRFRDRPEQAAQRAQGDKVNHHEDFR